MRAGLLREKAVFYQAASTQSETGAVSQAWQAVGTLRCYRKKQSDFDKLNGSGHEEVNAGNVTIQVRNNPILKDASMFVYNDESYKIVQKLHIIEDNTQIIFGQKRNEKINL